MWTEGCVSCVSTYDFCLACCGAKVKWELEGTWKNWPISRCVHCHLPKMAKKWKPWVSGSKCWHDLLVNKFSYMIKFRAEISYLGGRLVPLVEVTD